MGKARNFLIKDTTRVSITLLNLFLLVGTIVSGVMIFTTWKTQFEMNQKRLDERLTIEIEERKSADIDIENEMKEIKISITEIKSGQANILTGQARIEVDLKWLIDAWKRDNK